MADRKQERRGLGRGLSALMAEVQVAVPRDDAGASASGGSTAQATGAMRAVRPDMLVPVENLRPNPNQPRRDFAPDALAELAASVREKGVIQPLIVRELAPGSYEIVAGERRWRAAQMAQVHAVPVLVRDFTDTEVLEVAIIENIQRADLNAVEEATAFRQLMDRFGHTQEKLASAMGKSRSHIANLLRLLSLPDEVQGFVRDGRLSAGHARALITADNPLELARMVMDRGLSVRETERLVQTPKPGKAERSPKAGPAEKDADTRALELDLSANLGMRVSIDHLAVGDGAGVMTIRYRDLDGLDALCRLLSAAPLNAGH